MFTGRLGRVAHVQSHNQSFDALHRISKTPPLPTPPSGPARRDNAGCGTAFSTCAGSLGGGCCPLGYGCAVASCFATTYGSDICRGMVGWYGCPPVDGGGCCPDGYICDRSDQCRPPSGDHLSDFPDCPSYYHACPSSLGFGCCPVNMGCASSACYSTEPYTITISHLVTSIGPNGPVTATSLATTVLVPAALTTQPTNVVPADQTFLKYIPSSVPKATQLQLNPDSSSNVTTTGGLMAGPLAGIVVTAVALLVAVIVAAVLVIRYMGRRPKSAISQHASGSDRDRGAESRSPPNTALASVPLSSNGQTRLSTAGLAPSHHIDHLQQRNDSGCISTPSSAIELEEYRNRRSHPSRPGLDYRDGSIDSNNLTAVAYFDFSSPMRTRHHSVDSDLSSPSVTSLQPHASGSSDRNELSADSGALELEASSHPSALGTEAVAGDGTGMPPLIRSVRGRARRRSGGPDRPTRANSSSLGVLDEGIEQIVGYYGPADRMAGQTSAGFPEP